jgi:hypothetical protein
MLSLLLVLNHNTVTDSAIILASCFTPRRLFSMTMLRLYALWKVMQIAFRQSFAMLISIRYGCARRWKLEESLYCQGLFLTVGSSGVGRQKSSLDITASGLCRTKPAPQKPLRISLFVIEV